jgi:hypothetical protein
MVRISPRFEHKLVRRDRQIEVDSGAGLLVSNISGEHTQTSYIDLDNEKLLHVDFYPDELGPCYEFDRMGLTLQFNPPESDSSC